MYGGNAVICEKGKSIEQCWAGIVSFNVMTEIAGKVNLSNDNDNHKTMKCAIGHCEGACILLNQFALLFIIQSVVAIRGVFGKQGVTS